MKTPSCCALVAFGWLLAACGDGINPLAPAPPEVLRAPEQIVVSGVTLRLETYLFRDFAPISPPDGKPLIAGLRVRSTDGAAIPSGLVADTVWVLNAAAAWAAKAVQEHAQSDPSYVDLVARDGPKWGPSIEVDVVLRLRFGTGNWMLARAKGQPIHRTD